MARRIELISRVRSTDSIRSKTTSRSRSLSGPSSPCATEPKRTIRLGAAARTTSSTATGSHCRKVLPAHIYIDQGGYQRLHCLR